MRKVFGQFFGNGLLFVILVLHCTAGISRQLGDINNDSLLNGQDLLLLQNFVLEKATPSPDELVAGDVAPLGAPDDLLTAADIAVLEKAILGEITLPNFPDAPVVSSLSPTPTENPLPVTATATADGELRLYVNGLLQGSITVTKDQSYSMEAVLDDGSSYIYVTQWDGTTESLASPYQWVDYNNTLPRDIPGDISINANTVWTAGAQQQPYVIAGNLTIASGKTLILMPGVEIQFATSGKGVVVIGNLDVRGTLGNEVVLTSDEKQATGEWAGVTINSGGASSIVYAEISHAGRGINLQTNANSSSISHSLIHQNTTGIYIQGATVLPVSVTDSAIINNGKGVELHSDAAPSITGNSIYGNSAVNITTGSYYSDPANTAIDATHNWWGTTKVNEIEEAIFHAGDSVGAISYPTVDYSGYQVYEGGPADSARILVGPVTNQSHSLSPGEVCTVSGSLIVPASKTWTIPVGATLQFAEGAAKLIVQAGAQLNVEAGANLLFAKYGELKVYGTLDVNGQPDNKVIFTLLDQSGPAGWKGITIYSDATSSATIDHAEISLVTGNNSLFFNNTPNVSSVTNTRIFNNSTGIKVTGVPPQTLTLSGNSFVDNNKGLVLSSDAEPTISNNRFYDNALNIETDSYYSNPTNVVIDATNNWWGTAQLSEIEAGISHAGDSVSSVITRPLVDYSGYQVYEGGPADTNTILVGAVDNVGNPLSMNTVYTVAGSLVVPTDKTWTIPEGATLQFEEGAYQLIVQAGATLNVEAGATLMFARGGTFSSQLSVYGTLDVSGQPDNNVIFTSVAQYGPYDWAGIRIYSDASSSATIDHAQISYASQGIYFEDTANVSSITNSRIFNNEKGVEVTGSAVQSLTLTGNTITDNDIGISLLNDAQPIINNNSIYNNSSLNLGLGASSYSDPSNTIIDAKSNWWGSALVDDVEGGISHAGDSTAASVTQPLVDYSNYQSYPGGTGVDISSVLIGLQGNTRKSLNPGESYTTLGNLLVPAGETWTIPFRAVLELSGSLTVEAGAKLIVQAGAMLKFNNGVQSKLQIDGELDVSGVEDGEVVFTSADQTGPGDWGGIHITAGDGIAPVSIDYAIVEYAARGVFFDKTQSRASLTNSLIHLNGLIVNGSTNMPFYAGVSASGNSSPTISNNRIVNNLQAGIYLAGNGGSNPDPVVSGNTIMANGQLPDRDLYTSNFVNGSTVTLSQFTNNWWGDSSPAVIEDKIYHNTDLSSLPLVDFSAAAQSSVTPSFLTSNAIDYRYISPTSSSQVQDSSHFTGTINELSDWVVTIRDMAGATVKTYSSIAATTAIDQVWDGTDDFGNPVGDGLYIFHVSATSAARSGVVAIKAVWVDNVLPVASISAPVDGSSLQNTLSQLVSGTAADGLTFDYYTLEYEAGANPGVKVPVSSTQQSYTSPSFENLGDWIVGSEQGVAADVIPNGSYTLYLTVRDKAGNQNSDSVTLSINNLSITQVALTSSEIDLSTSGSVDFSFFMNMPGSVTIRFYDELSGPSGPLLGSITHNCQAAGQCTVSWDGSLNGQPLADGAYFYEIESNNGGYVGLYSHYTRDDYKNYDIVAGYYRLGAGQQGTFNAFTNDWFNVSYTLPSNIAPNVYGRVILQVYSQSQTPIDVSGGGILTPPGGSDIIDWNGIFPDTGVPRDEAIDYLTFYRPLSENIVVIRNSSVSNSEPGISGQGAELEVKADPYLVTLSYGQLSTLRYHLSTADGNPTTVTLKLLPPGVSQFDDPSAIPVFTQSLAPGDHTYDWDGIDSSDIEQLKRTIDDEGPYVFAIKAGNTIYKGVINVYQ